MSNSVIEYPHIYKKGKILNFKRLKEGIEEDKKSYLFSSLSGNNRISAIISSTNNLNQITGRTLLGIYKLLSYFGLSKDPSEEWSKEPSIYGKFSVYYQRGGGIAKLSEVKNLIVEQDEKIKKLANQIELIKNSCSLCDLPISRQEVLDFTDKLNKIEKYLEKILG